VIGSLCSVRLRNWVIAVVVAATAAIATGVMAADGFGGTQSAHATIDTFCSNHLISGGSRARCSWPLTSLNQVESDANFSGAAHCAIGKQNDDGSGGNVIDPGCGTGGNVQTNCVSAHVGYPYIINNSVNAHTFTGLVAYNGGACIGA
jgi:hypothetical protein